MKTVKVLVFVVAMFCLSSCMSPGSLGEKVDRYYNDTLATLASVKSGVDAGLQAVIERRKNEGVSEGEDLDWKDWIIILGAVASSALGVNTIRDRKYVRKQVDGNGNPPPATR